MIPRWLLGVVKTLINPFVRGYVVVGLKWQMEHMLLICGGILRIPRQLLGESRRKLRKKGVNETVGPEKFRVAFEATLLGTNISLFKGTFESMIFLLVPWRVYFVVAFEPENHHQKNMQKDIN